MESGSRTALILGASSVGGLGEAAARRLSDEGYRLILAGRRPETLDDLAAETAARIVRCDLPDEGSIADMIGAAGRFDVLVNAAGTTVGGSIAKIERAAIEAQYAIHVTANLLLMKHAAPVMPAGGSIILFSSLVSGRAGMGLSAYAAAKAALDQVVRIAALEFGPRGLRVNAVAPGFSLTPMTQGFLATDRLNALYRRESALGALVLPEQVAATVAHLAAPDCFMTGEIVQVSGGAQLCRLPRFEELRV